MFYISFGYNKVLEDFLKYPQNYINIEKECKTEINNIIETLRKSGVQTNFSSFKLNVINNIKETFSFSKDLNEMVQSIVNNIPILQQESKCIITLLTILQKTTNSI